MLNFQGQKLYIFAIENFFSILQYQHWGSFFQDIYSFSCNLSATSVGTGTNRRPKCAGTDRYKTAQTDTEPIATGTDRYKIARDDFF